MNRFIVVVMGGNEFLRVVLCAAFLASAGAVAQAEELKNDGFANGGTAAVQLGFIEGEEAAAEFTLTSAANPWKLNKIRFFFGGSPGTEKTITLNVYAASAEASPGALLYTKEYQATGSDDALNEIDLNSDNWIVTGDFRIGIKFQHAGAPSVARDDDGTFALEKNFIYGGTWGYALLSGVLGDWIIRVDVTEQITGGTPDAGTGGGTPDANTGGGTPDASTGGGTPDASTGSGSPDAGTGTVPGPDAGLISGDTCQFHSDCARGAHCGEQSVCSVECRVDIDCEGGNTCNTELGRCEEAAASSGGCSTGKSSGGLGGLLLLLGLVALRPRRRN